MERPDHASEISDALLDPQSDIPRGAITPDGRVATRRFQVYRNNVVSGLIDALATGFPVTQKLVGETFFRAMAGVFIRQSPPKSPILTEFGDGFAAFIKDFEPARKLPYLADIARIEYARRLAYHAANAPVCGGHVLQELGDALPAARLVLHPATQIIASPYPVHSIYRANLENRKPDLKGPETTLITRPQFEVFDCIAPTGCDHFIAALAEQPLGAAAETVLAENPHADIPTMIGLLFQSGAVTDIRTSS